MTPQSGNMPVLTARLLFVIAMGAGLAVANLYYSQPILGLIGNELHNASHISLVTTVTQISYAVGLLLLVPLCDILDRRNLILLLCLVLVFGCCACALAPDLLSLIVASVAMGLAACITQMLLPVAADLATDETRGKSLGFALSGALSGILLARVASGFIAQWLGWRAAFWMAAMLAIMLFVMMEIALPTFPRKTKLPYTALLHSMLFLPIQFRALRFACLIQACIFGAFSAFWSVFAIYLEGQPFHLGAAATGFFGLIGIVGILSARGGGNVIDRFGARSGVFLGILACTAAFGIMAATRNIASLVISVVLLDCGLSLSQVSNQSVILGLSDESRGRINTVYMTSLFIGGALGSAIAGYEWNLYQWQGVVATCGGLCIIAVITHIVERTKK